MAYSSNDTISDNNNVSCSFTIPSSSVTSGAVYSTGGMYFVVTATISSSVTLVASGPATPSATGTLTLVYGTGPSSLAYSAVSATSIIAPTVTVKGPGAAPTASDMAEVMVLSPSGNSVVDQANASSSSYPDPGSVVGSPAALNQDVFGNLITRGTVLTDEGSFRDDFSGSSLATTLTGTITVVNGSPTVTGTSTTFTTQVRQFDYVKISSQTEAMWTQVATVVNDTQLVLTQGYLGASAGPVAGQFTHWRTTTATGGSITVANSTVTLASGTTSGQHCNITKVGDYLPYSLQFYASVSQRIANQTTTLGFADAWTTPSQQCTIQLSGTNNAAGNFVTAFSSQATDIQTTAFTYPNGGNSSTQHLYKIDLSANAATLSIDGVVVAQNNQHLPSPYTNLLVVADITNTGTAGSSTNVILESVFFENIDRLQIDHDFIGEPIPTQITAPLPSGSNQIGKVGFGQGVQEVFGTLTTSNRTNQLEDTFHTGTLSLIVNLTTSGTGTGTIVASGVAQFSTGTGATAQSKGVSLQAVVYTVGAEIYANWTTAFTTPTSAASYQRVGLYDASNGFSLGYNGTTFGLWARNQGVDTFVAQSSWNTDTLSGASNSQFTSGGAPQVADWTHGNLFRVRFGWLGFAPVLFEIANPDGGWVLFHTLRYPNSSASPSIANPNLPLTIDCSKTSSDATNLIMSIGGWSAGTAVNTPSLTQDISTSSINSTTTQLAAGSTFTGITDEAISSNGIQLLSFSDQQMTIQLQQSQDSVNWDINDTYITPTGSDARTFTSVAPYFRVLATNNGASTTTQWRLTVTQVPILNVEPRGLNNQLYTTITANGQAAVLNLNGHPGCGFELYGTWTGTIVPQALIGVNWFTIDVFLGIFNGETVTNSFVAAGAVDFQGEFILPSGATQVRLTSTAWTSGTAQIAMVANQIPFNYELAVRGNGDAIGSYGSQTGTANNPGGTFVFDRGDSAGNKGVYLNDSPKTTYSATSAVTFASAASATDIFVIGGSGTKTIRVIRMGFNATQTTAGSVNVLLIKRSAANNGGTSAAATLVPHDSTDAAATATVVNYTANPTINGTVGTVRAVRAFIPTSTTTTPMPQYEFDFGSLPEKAIVLRGTAQQLAINLNGVTVTGGAWVCWCEWTEE